MANGVTENAGNSTSRVWPIIVAAIAGGLLGHYLPNIALKTKFLGDIFLSLLFVLVIPLIMSSMISSVTRLGDIRHIESIGLKTIVFYLTSTFIAVCTGLFFVELVNPGSNAEITQTEFPNTSYTIESTPLAGGSLLHLDNSGDKLKNAIDPTRGQIRLIDQDIYGTIDNIGANDASAVAIETWHDEEGRRIEPRTTGTGVQVTNVSNRMSSRELIANYIPRNLFRAMFQENIFPLIVFCLAFGVVLTTVGEVGFPLIAVVDAINATSIKCVILLMNLAPIGIFGLTAGSIGQAELANPEGFVAELVRLARYAITVIMGLGVHGAITLVLILTFVAGRKPLRFIKNMVPQLVTAFSTGSSMATLPVSMTLLTEKNKVSDKIADFVLPLGATINMDGTALYQIVAASYIAQVYQVHLSMSDKVVMLLTATIGSIGAAAIPQAGLVTLVLVLKSVGLPVEGIGMILSIDWFIDRCRTTVNSWGDVVGATVIDRFENKERADL